MTITTSPTPSRILDDSTYDKSCDILFVIYIYIYCYCDILFVIYCKSCDTYDRSCMIEYICDTYDRSCYCDILFVIIYILYCYVL